MLRAIGIFLVWLASVGMYALLQQPAVSRAPEWGMARILVVLCAWIGAVLIARSR